MYGDKAARLLISALYDKYENADTGNLEETVLLIEL